jgi:hypothetical protein
MYLSVSSKAVIELICFTPILYLSIYVYLSIYLSLSFSLARTVTAAARHIVQLFGRLSVQHLLVQLISCCVSCFVE